MLNIVGKKKIYLTIAVVLVLASAISLIFQGFKLDTDFAGGIAVSYTIDGKTTEKDKAEMEKLIKEVFGKDASQVRLTDSVIDIEIGYDQKLSEKENMEKTNANIETLNYKVAEKWGKIYAVVDANGNPVVGNTGNEVDSDADAKKADENTAAASAETTNDATTAEADAAAATETAATTDTASADTANNAIAAANGNTKPDDGKLDAKHVISYNGYKYYVEGVSKSELNVVSPSTARNLAMSALWMSLLAVAAILIYVSIRFEFVSGVSAIIALVHDIVILCGVYSIFRIKVDTNFIAAVLTVLGYSINNTIVIMDRIRENMRKAKKETYAEIANVSINQTLRRSLNTTITTLLTIGAVYILGVTSIKEFALPIIIGIVVGTYSSIFVSGSVWSMWRDGSVNAKKSGKTAKATK